MNRPRLYTRWLALGLLCLAIASLIALTTRNRATSASSSTETGTLQSPLIVLPESKLELAKTPKGAVRETTLWIQNTLQEPVTIESVETTCPCARVLLPTTTVWPQEKIAALVEVNLSRQASAPGALVIHIQAATKQGSPAFSCRLVVDVLP